MINGKDYFLRDGQRLYIIIFIFVLIVSFLLTFLNLEKRSLLNWDEAYYLNIVKTWRSGIDWLIYKIFRPAGIMQVGFSDYILEYGGAVNTFARDGFLTVVLLFSYFFGLRDVTILWVSGIFGVLTVWLIYLIGKEAFDRVAGLLSSGILAISLYHLHYSRSGFSQSTSVFFLYLAGFLYLLSYRHRSDTKMSERFLFFSGFTLGYAFSCNYSLGWALPFFFILEIVNRYMSIPKITFGNFLKRIFILFLGIFIPILFWSGVSRLIKFILYLNPAAREAIRGSSGVGTFVPYFGRFFDFFTPSLSKPASKVSTVYLINQLNPLFYVKLLLWREGPFLLILLLIGTVRLIYRQIRQRIFLEFTILILFLVPFLFWSLCSWKLSRLFAPVIPAISLVVGSLLAQVIERKCKTNASKTLAILIILFILIFQAQARLKKELSFTSGYPMAIKFMREHQGLKHLSSQFTISRFFVGRKNALDISTSFENTDVARKLNELYDKQGYRYLLLDQGRYLFANSPIIKAAERSKPILVVPHSTDADLFEVNMVGVAEKVCRAPKVLEVYELSDIIRNLK